MWPSTPADDNASHSGIAHVAFDHENSSAPAISSFIAVGMVIADHPPHRSEHALLTHSAPTSSM